ncbi:MAG: PDZ domain-containing protein [Dokdonella sp.]
MKRILATLLLATSLSALASDPATNAKSSSAPKPASAATPTSGASDAAPADQAQARRELADVQKQIGELSRRMAELSLQLGDAGPRAYAYRYLADSKRAIVGVVIAPDSKGARISALTPNGPAARAGLHNDDVITSVNGKSIVAESPDKTLAAARESLNGLKDGDDVRIGFLRADKPQRELTVKAERVEALNWPRVFAGGDRFAYAFADADGVAGMDDHNDTSDDADEPSSADPHVDKHVQVDIKRMREMERTMQKRVQLMRGAMPALAHSMPWWGINLASLNPDLGRYFGSSDGVLVLSASDDALPNIKAGDVIRKVGGKSVNRPEEALRALRDHDAGSEVTIDLLRDRKSIAMKVNVPEYKSIFELPPLPPTPPVPPVAPKGLAAPAALPAPAAVPEPAPVPVVAPVPPVPPVDGFESSGVL